jgi:DNA-binding transcriptional regulator GbsR (MarR family)
MTPLMERFILHWGEMGSRWGVNRSVSQIHALLFVLARPTDADEIAETLQLARSNVSTGLKELQAYGLVKRVPRVGDRKDRFEALGSPWDMFLQIVEMRRQREVQPTLEALRALVEDAAGDKDTPQAIKQRIGELHRFGEDLDRWYREIRRLPVGTLKLLLRMGAKIAHLIPGGKTSGRE